MVEHSSHTFYEGSARLYGRAVTGFALIWAAVGVFMFFANAAGKDSRGVSIYDSSFIVLYVVFGGGLLGSLWFAFQSFRRAFP